LESFDKKSKADLDNLTRLRSLTMFCADFEGYSLRTPAVSLPQVQGKVTVDADPTVKYDDQVLVKVTMNATQFIYVTHDTDKAKMVFPFTRDVTFWLVPGGKGAEWRIHQYGGSYEMTAAVPDTTKP